MANKYCIFTQQKALKEYIVPNAFVNKSTFDPKSRRRFLLNIPIMGIRSYLSVLDSFKIILVIKCMTKHKSGKFKLKKCTTYVS